MSTGLNKTHQRRDVILASLCDYFGKSTIDNLLLCGFLRVIEKLQTDELDGISIASKIHKKTKNIVPDELATPDNEEGIIAELPHLKEGFPACPIVVRIGFHIPFVHRGAGSRHLTGNVIEFPNRDFFPKEENKTEGSLKGLVEVLKNSSQLYQLNPLKYVFYSSKHQYGIVCTLNEKSNRLEVVTVRPVRKKELPQNLWGNQWIKISGALIFPDQAASVPLSSCLQTTERKHTEPQSTKSHEDNYLDVDYTPALRNAIERAKRNLRSDANNIQGFYSKSKKIAVLVAENLSAVSAPSVLLHELGIHMAYDTFFKNKLQPIIEEAPSLLEHLVAKSDPIGLYAQSQLTLAQITKKSKGYKEEVCAYLVESCALHAVTEPSLIRWFNGLKSKTSVWLYEHGFKEVDKLSPRDLVTIAKANVKEIARQKPEVKLSPGGMEVLAEHVKAMNFKYSKITDAEPEIKTLYRKFVELEQAGKPLPKAAVVERRTGGMQR